MKITKYVISALIVVFILIQFVPVAKTNPPVTAEIDAPADVKDIIRRSCYDCHSNESSWPWYSKIAPFSWFVIDHVNEAREEFNFSTWDKYSKKKKAKVIEEIWEEVEEEEMPLWSYTILHSDAKLSEAEKEVIHKWSSQYVSVNQSKSKKHED